MIDDDFDSLNLKSSISDIKTLLSQQIVALEFLEKKLGNLDLESLPGGYEQIVLSSLTLLAAT